MANPPDEYTLGQPVILKGELQTGTPLADIDPTTAVVKVRRPQDPVIITDFWPGGAGNLVHASVGVFTFTVTPDKPGRWWYRFESTGTVGAGETSFMVKASRF